MQGQPPSTGGRHSDRRLDFCLDPLPRQGRHHQLALPRQIGRIGPVLHRCDPAFGIGLGMDRLAVRTGLDQVKPIHPAAVDGTGNHFAR